MAKDAKAEKVTPIVIEGFEINAPNMTFQKLQEFALTLFERLLLQRRERNKLMTERDRLLAVLTNVRHEIRTSEAAAMNAEAEMEAAEVRHRQAVKEVEQEVKWLEYDHKIKLEHLKAWEHGILLKSDEECFQETAQLMQEKRRLKEEFAEEELKFIEQTHLMKKEHAQEIEEIKSRQEALLIEKEMEFRRSLVELKGEMTLRHEMEMSETEERKNCHLMELKIIHKTRLEEFKRFFNSVASENLAVINALKQSLEGIEKNKAAMKEEMVLLTKTNKRLKIPLEKSRGEVRELKRQLINYEKNQTSLKNNKRMLRETSEELQRIRLNSREILRALVKGDVEVSEMSSFSCISSIIRFRNYASNRRKQLDELIDERLHDLRRKQCTIQRLAADPGVARILEELDYEHWDPFDIYYEVHVVKAAYDELLATLEGKLKEFCVPESMGGHGPWRARPEHGPAGLVSRHGRTSNTAFTANTISTTHTTRTTNL